MTIPQTGRLGAVLGRLASELETAWADDGPDRVVADRDRWQAALDRPLPDVGREVDAVVDDLVEHVVPYGPRLHKPGFWGWITTGPTTTGVAAALAAGAVSPQRYLLTAFNHLEAQSLQWLQELLGIPPGHQGVYSTGGSVANLVGLGAARQAAYEAVGRDPSADGVDRPGRVYASVEAHHTIQRSAAVLGLGRRSVFAAPVDDRQRVDVGAVAEAVRADLDAGVLPVAIVATAGTTNTGAIDPVEDLADLAEEHGIWFHVDGAYGLFAVTDAETKPAFAGVERADSAIVDPHKWLAAPVGIGATFVRDAALLHRAFTEEPAAYLEGSFGEAVGSQYDDLGVPYSDFGVELSSPARGVVVWALLSELGRAGVGAIVRRDLDFACRLADRVRDEPDLELLGEPQLSICCFRHRGSEEAFPADLDARNQRILSRLRAETPYAPSSTVVDGAFALRACFINPRTTDEDVDGLVDAVVALGAEEAAG